MPTYTIENTETGEVSDMVLTLAQREQLLQDPKYKQHLAAPRYGDSVRLGIRRHDNEFNDLVKTIKKNHLGSTIETR